MFLFVLQLINLEYFLYLLHMKYDVINGLTRTKPTFYRVFWQKIWIVFLNAKIVDGCRALSRLQKKKKIDKTSFRKLSRLWHKNMFFDQLLGDDRTRKLVETHFFSFSTFFVILEVFWWFFLWKQEKCLKSSV